jgi:hypothetical protein
MKKLVVLAALACALAAMPSVPQHAYACQTGACATDDSTATQVPAAAKGDRLDRGVQQACQSPTCATEEQKATQTAGCSGSSCATEEQKGTQTAGCSGASCATEENPGRAAASLSAGGAALGKAVRAVKERIRQQRTGCATADC